MPSFRSIFDVPMNSARQRHWAAVCAVVWTWSRLSSAQLTVEEARKGFAPCAKVASPADVDAAKAKHRIATEAFDQAEHVEGPEKDGRYKLAILYWLEAYNLDCSRPVIFLNLGKAFEKMGDRKAALVAYETFLERAPDDRLARTTAATIANLRAALAVEEAARMEQKTMEGGAVPTEPLPPKVAPTHVAPQEKPWSYWPWVAVGAGGALALTGAILLPVGYGKVSDLESECGSDHSQCTTQDQVDRGDQAYSRFIQPGGALLGVGLAAAAGGVAWELFWNKPRTGAATGWQVLPAGSTLHVRTSF